MNTPSKSDIEFVLNGFEEFLSYVVKTHILNLDEFVNFMEPRFKAAGYRSVRNSKVSGGGAVLIIHDAGAGDFIMQSAAIREIRRLYPYAHITLIVNGPAFNLAECCPYVNELHEMLGYFNFFDAFRFNISIASRLLEQRFDVCYAFAQYTGTPFLMYMSGARIRIAHVNDGTCTGFTDVPISYSINLATHLFPKFLYGRHVVDNALSFVDGTLFSPTPNRKIEVWYSPLDYSVARSHLHFVAKPIYALGIGGSRRRKHYPPEKYAQLLEMILREESTTTFVILGGGQSDLKSAEIIRNIAPQIYAKNIIDLVNKISYRQNAVVLKFCDMYIGNDTGTMHIAAAVGCPVLSPDCFAEDLPEHEGNVIPYIYSPYGVPSVIVRPEHALPECKNSDVYDQYGCKANFPHCITQIEPKTLFKGFHLLKERAAKKINEPLYIH